MGVHANFCDGATKFESEASEWRLRISARRIISTLSLAYIASTNVTV